MQWTSCVKSYSVCWWCKCECLWCIVVVSWWLFHTLLGCRDGKWFKRPRFI